MGGALKQKCILSQKGWTTQRDAIFSLAGR